MANFKALSRYTGGLATKNRTGKDFLVLRTPLELVAADDDTFITLTKEVITRPDLISSKVYKTPDLWWVILEFNGIADPLFELKVGQTLRIPELERVIAAINSLDIS